MHRGAKVQVTRGGKTRNVPAALYPAYNKRGWVQTTGASAPVEAKKTKPKKEAENVDSEE